MLSILKELLSTDDVYIVAWQALGKTLIFLSTHPDVGKENVARGGLVEVPTGRSIEDDSP